MKSIVKSFIIILFLLNSLFLFAQNQKLIPYRKGSLMGFCDKNKKIIIPPKYNMIYTKSVGFIAENSEGERCILNDLGEDIGSFYTEIREYSNGYAAVNKNGLWGFINKNGEKICLFKYDEVSNFENNRALVKKNNRYGFINETGNEIIPLQFEEAYSFSNGLAIVAFKGNLYCGADGAELEFNKIGLITPDGKEKVRSIYKCIEQNSKFYKAYPNILKKNGYVSLDYNVFDVYDLNGNLISKITESNYSDNNLTYEFYDGLRREEKEGKYGFLNSDGEIDIPFKFDWADNFQDGLAVVKIKDKFGVIDKRGKYVIECKYDFLSNFINGYATIGKAIRNSENYKYGLIDKIGKIIIPMEYDVIGNISEGLVCVFKGERKVTRHETGPEDVELIGKFGFINTSGKVVIPLKYSEASSFNNGIALVKLNGISFYINSSGLEYYEK